MSNGTIFTPWGVNHPEMHIDRTCTLFDAFGRLRTSEPVTIFDSKLSFSKLNIYWSEKINGGATSTHTEADSCVRMTVNTTGDYVVRQTRQRWNYQPGKSACLTATVRMCCAQGVRSRVGLCHGGYATPSEIHDGISFELDNGIAYCCITKGTDGSGVISQIRVPQSEWNIDRLDGNGASGAIADWNKAQIFQVDYQWLGVGGVRFGFEVDSVMVYVHEFRHAGVVETVYMHNGTQPVRYDIKSIGGAGTMDHICSTVVSEGGRVKTGVTGSVDTNGTLISCASGVLQMLLAIRMNPDTPDAQILVEKVYALNTANTSYRWVLLWNPTITGTPNWITLTDTPMQVWRNAGTNITVSGGFQMDSGYASRDSRQSNETTDPSVSAGISVDGVPDTIVLAIESIGGTSTCSGGIGFRHLI